MSKSFVWTSIASSVFIAISTIDILAGKTEIGLVMAVNAVALAILALRDN